MKIYTEKYLISKDISNPVDYINNPHKYIKGKIIRVALYIRVSTEEQAKHGYSIESQITRLKEYCKANNYQIVDIYVDEGKSARTKLSNRKELLRLLDDVNNDKIDRIIMWRLDRWFRNVADYYKVQEILNKNDVDWECSDEDYNTTTSNGRLYLNMKLSIAQNESDQTSDRIKFNFESMVKNKRPIFGSQSLPVGLRVVGEKHNKKVVKDPDTEQMAIDMIEKYEETLSLSATTRYLNENYPFRPIGYECVKKFLKNPMYYGTYRGVEDYCEAYITKERWDNIQTLISRNQRKNNRSTHLFIFSGLIKCYDCNRRMSGSIGRRKHADGSIIQYGTYKCSKHFLDSQCTNNHTINERKLENWLIENFIKELTDYTISIEKIDEKQSIQKNINKIDNLNQRLNRLNDLYIDGRITKEKYELEYNEIQKQLSYEIKLKDIPKIRDLSKYKEILNNNNIIELYQKLTPENKRKFWYKYIDHIIQDQEKEFIVFFK